MADLKHSERGLRLIVTYKLGKAAVELVLAGAVLALAISSYR